MTSAKRGFVFVPPTDDALTHRTGTLMVAIAATVSCLCSSVLLSWILYLVVSMYRRQMRERISKFAFLRTQFGVLFANLLMADFIQSLAFLMNYYWYFTEKMPAANISGLCSVQGIGIQAGDMASALWSFIIAAHTICFIVWRYKPSNKVAACVVPLVWLIVVIMASIGPLHVYYLTKKGESHPPFYNTAGLWCWISLDYEPWRVYAHYLWVFVSAFGSLTMYSAIFLWLWFRLFQRGVYNHQLFRLRRAADGRLVPTSPIPLAHQSNAPVIQPTTAISPSSEKSDSGDLSASSKAQVQPRVRQRVKDAHAIDRNRKVDKAALMMLLFPASYILSVLPLAAFRLARISKQEWSYNLNVQAGCGFLFALGGTFNAILYVLTRKIFQKNKHSEVNSTSGPTESAHGTAIQINLSHALQGGENIGPDGKPIVSFPAGLKVTNGFKFNTDLFLASGGISGGSARRGSRHSKALSSSSASMRDLHGDSKRGSIASIGGGPAASAAAGRRPTIQRKPSGLSQQIRFASVTGKTGTWREDGTWDDGLSFHSSSEEEGETGDSTSVNGDDEERGRIGAQAEIGTSPGEEQRPYMFNKYSLPQQQERLEEHSVEGEEQTLSHRDGLEDPPSPGTHTEAMDPLQQHRQPLHQATSPDYMQEQP